jgi:hypothetical protein
MKAFTVPLVALFGTAATLWSASASAQDAARWQFTGSLNLYLPTMSGSTVFPPPATGGSSASVDIDKILDNLKFTFMGSLDAHNGQWGAFTDLIYLDLGNSKTGSRSLTLGGVELPAGVAADVRYDLSGWSWTLGGEWRAVSKPNYSLDVIAGARLLDIQQKLGWTLTGNIGSVAVPDRTGARDSRLSNWDAIIGVKGRYTFGESGKWFVPYYLDVGTGNSDLTTQALAGVGYSFGWGEVVGSWRYLGYNMKSDQVLQDLSFNGPMISAVFHW